MRSDRRVRVGRVDAADLRGEELIGVSELRVWRAVAVLWIYNAVSDLRSIARIRALAIVLRLVVVDIA